MTRASHFKDHDGQNQFSKFLEFSNTVKAATKEPINTNDLDCESVQSENVGTVKPGYYESVKIFVFPHVLQCRHDALGREGLLGHNEPGGV